MGSGGAHAEMTATLEPWPERPGLLLLTVWNDGRFLKNVCQSDVHAAECAPILARRLARDDPGADLEARLERIRWSAAKS